MEFGRTFVVLLLLVVSLGGSQGQLGWCRRSAFKVPCSQLEAAKKVWWKQCPGVAPASDFIESSGDCCSVVQKTRNADSWEAYRKCEHSTALYLRSFKPKVAACASLAAKGPCSSVLSTKN